MGKSVIVTLRIVESDSIGRKVSHLDIANIVAPSPIEAWPMAHAIMRELDIVLEPEPEPEKRNSLYPPKISVEIHWKDPGGRSGGAYGRWYHAPEHDELPKKGSGIRVISFYYAAMRGKHKSKTSLEDLQVQLNKLTE